MAMIDWIKQRFSKPRYVSDKAVSDFTAMAKDQGLQFDYGTDKRLVHLLRSNDDPARNMEEIAKLLGQSPK